ncbi:mitochondrial ribosomal subunit S27-domain-containing protein [Nemania sp. FL0916]|nr:mitochondrial ribosomal subunit S27-domain-containing protein [Nemania sp. FL0916]
MAAVSRTRLLNLMEAQCQIFSTTYNPDRLRMGNKILRQRLRGPSLVKYYPPPGPGIREVERAFKDLELETWWEEEDDRLDYIEGRKQRGKGVPKKKRTATPSDKRVK